MGQYQHLDFKSQIYKGVNVENTWVIKATKNLHNQDALIDADVQTQLL